MLPLTDLLDLLRCPLCRAPLHASADGAVCQGAAAHPIPVDAGYLRFGAPDPGKYDPEYAARYAGLWAYGYLTQHFGFDESLYRSVSSLVAESLQVHPGPGEAPVIIDAGCGVGRVTRDCAVLAPRGRVVSFDGSLAMLDLANRITCGSAAVDLPLAAFGFGTVTIPGQALDNIFLARADVEALPLADESVDIILSVNIVDRLVQGPKLAIAECHRVLRPGGRLIFTDPLNWTDPILWELYDTREKVLDHFRESGFRIDTWFDQLHYRELLDRWQSFDEFTTLVVAATKPGR